MVMPRLRTRLSVEALEDRRVPTTFADTRFIESVVATGLAAPTALARAPDGRLFITEQGGRVRIVQNGQLLATPFLTVNTDPAGERGLLGVTFDPNFSSNGFVYIYYTVPAAGGSAPFNRVSRFTANGNTAVVGSELVLMNLDPLSSATNHNGGALHFGLDGKLYIAVGDNANPANAQSLANRHGKILRINPDGSIPSDNPTAFDGLIGTPTGANRAIWAVGLRNPFTFAVQPGSGTLFINDVGQASFEEINLGRAGANYGWSQTEGPTPAGVPGVTYPIYSYSRGFGELQGFAITGGAFYNPSNPTFPPELVGDYFFADFVTNRIYLRDSVTGNVTTFARDLTGTGTVDLDVLPNGGLLYLSRGGGPNTGAVYLISFAPNSAPAITSPPESQLVPIGEDVPFSVSVGGNGPFTYQWLRNGSPIMGATGSTYSLPSAQLSDSGAIFQVDVTNAFGTTRSAAATLTVVNNQRPNASINLPGPGTVFRAGDTITFSGSAFDPETGTLPPSAFTWRVDYITGSAEPRPFLPPTSGITSGSFTTATITPYLLTDVAYRITLIVTDPIGLTRTVTRDVLPVVGMFTLTSNLPGVTFTLDGQPIAAGTSTLGVVGVERSIGAPLRITVGGREYVFDRWSDRGRLVHTISTPEGNVTLVAHYRSVDQIAVTTAGSPVVAVFDAATGIETRRFLAYNPAFTGEVRVAMGDVDGDNIADIITAAGPGGGPHVQVFSGATGEVIRSFFAYNPAFAGGVYVASADVNGDGFDDIITGLGVGGGPHVQVFCGRTGATLMSFFAYNPLFSGGVNVAAGDFDGDGFADIITAAGPGGGPHVQVFSGRTGEVLLSFFAFDPLFPGGVNVAAGDFDFDGRVDLVTSVAFGGTPHVRVRRATDLADLASFFAYDPTFLGGVRVGVADGNGDGIPDVITAPGSGGGADVRAYRLPDGVLVNGVFAFDLTFLGGAYVGAG